MRLTVTVIISRLASWNILMVGRKTMEADGGCCIPLGDTLANFDLFVSKPIEFDYRRVVRYVESGKL